MNRVIKSCLLPISLIAALYCAGCAAQSTGGDNGNENDESQSSDIINDENIDLEESSSSGTNSVKKLNGDKKGCPTCGPLPDPWSMGPLPDPWKSVTTSSTSSGDPNDPKNKSSSSSGNPHKD